MVPDLGSRRDFFELYIIYLFFIFQCFFHSFLNFLSLESSALAWEKEATSKPTRKTSETLPRLVDVTRYFILPWTWIGSWQTWHFIIRPAEGKQTTSVHCPYIHQFKFICHPMYLCPTPTRLLRGVCVWVVGSTCWCLRIECGVHTDSGLNRGNLLHNYT